MKTLSKDPSQVRSTCFIRINDNFVKGKFMQVSSFHQRSYENEINLSKRYNACISYTCEFYI